MSAEKYQAVEMRVVEAMVADALKGQKLLVDALARNARLVEALEKISVYPADPMVPTHLLLSFELVKRIARDALERETADES